MINEETMKSHHDATARLARAMERETSIGWRFLLGLVWGVGTAIGATIVATLLLFVLVKLFQSIGWQEKIDEWKAQMQAEISSEVQASQQQIIDEATAKYLR